MARNEPVRRIACVFALALSLLLGADCGGGSGGSGESGEDCATPTQDMTGTWSITESSDSTDCGKLDDGFTWSADQTGGSVIAIVVTGEGPAFTGFMCGERVEADTPFSYPEDGGTTTVSSMLFTVMNDTLQGTYEWTWSDGLGGDCEGTTTFNGTWTP